MNRAESKQLRQLAIGMYIFTLIVFAVFPFSATGMTAVNKITVVHFRLDHLFHVFALIPAYPLLAWVLNPKYTMAYIGLFLLAMFIGFSAEFVQYFIDYRSYNLADLYANMGGVIIGSISTFLFLFMRKRVKHNG